MYVFAFYRGPRVRTSCIRADQLPPARAPVVQNGVRRRMCFSCRRRQRALVFLYVRSLLLKMLRVDPVGSGRR